MTRNWTHITRREKSVCRLGTPFSEILVSGRCRFFECPAFRSNMCRRQIMLNNLENSTDTESSYMWVDDSEFIVKITHYGQNSDEEVLQIFDDFRYIWDNSDVEMCNCCFEKEVMRLQRAVLNDLKNAM